MMAFLKLAKKKNNYLFLFFANKFLLFSISRMNVEESIIEKLQKNNPKRDYKIERKKVRKKEKTLEIFQHFAFVF
jgi:hypothetical protein